MPQNRLPINGNGYHKFFDLDINTLIEMEGIFFKAFSLYSTPSDFKKSIDLIILDQHIIKWSCVFTFRSSLCDLTQVS